MSPRDIDIRASWVNLTLQGNTYLLNKTWPMKIESTEHSIITDTQIMGTSYGSEPLVTLEFHKLAQQVLPTSKTYRVVTVKTAILYG